MDKFQNKYRIPSARAQWWDYGQNGAYFVTICTAHRECFFGNVVNGEMQLSEIGKIANNHWLEIPTHFPIVFLDAFVVMPNHVHGIIIINKQEDTNIETHADDDTRHVETRLIASLQSPLIIKTGGFAGNKNPMLNDNLSHVLK
jgi:hypothetical protein